MSNTGNIAIFIDGPLVRLKGAFTDAIVFPISEIVALTFPAQHSFEELVTWGTDIGMDIHLRNKALKDSYGGHMLFDYPDIHRLYLAWQRHLLLS